MKTTKTSAKDRILKMIAAQHLGIETLETRKSGSLDFHELAVWAIEKALSEAFEAGANAVKGQRVC